MGERIHRKNCQHYENCLQTIVMNYFANLGGRSLTCLPECRNCNAYCKKEKTNEEK